MKNKKNMFVLAIVALILVLGVGYAVVTSTTLTINGTASAKENELDVVYTGVNNGTTNVTTISAAADSKAATFTVTNMVVGTAESAEFQIKNKETDVDASVAYPSTFTNSNSNFFNAKLYYDDGNGYSEWTSGAKDLAANATAKIKVEVTLTKNPVASEDSSTTITVAYTASPKAQS